MVRRAQNWHTFGMPMNDSGTHRPPASLSPSLTIKGVRTRQRIVASAAELMFTHGVAGTTLEDVRAAAAVSSSQLYHYFSDKQDLVRAVVAYQSDAIVGHHEQADLGSLEALRTWRDSVVAHVGRLNGLGGCPLGSLGSELAETDADARMDVAAGFDRWEAALRNGLRTIHANGVLRPEADPDALALATLAALQGGLLLAQIQRNSRPLETALDAMLTLIHLQTAASPQANRPATSRAPA